MPSASASDNADQPEQARRRRQEQQSPALNRAPPSATARAPASRDRPLAPQALVGGIVVLAAVVGCSASGTPPPHHSSGRGARRPAGHRRFLHEHPRHQARAGGRRSGAHPGRRDRLPASWPSARLRRVTAGAAHRFPQWCTTTRPRRTGCGGDRRARRPGTDQRSSRTCATSTRPADPGDHADRRRTILPGHDGGAASQGGACPRHGVPGTSAAACACRSFGLWRWRWTPSTGRCGDEDIVVFTDLMPPPP